MKTCQQHLRQGGASSQRSPSSDSSWRRGFTLVELMISIVIIGILAAMIFPAYRSIQETARTAQVTVEIKNLEAAIANFKLEYGVEPPSFIVLYETGEALSTPYASQPDTSWGKDTGGSTGLSDAHRIASRAAIKKIWPDFDFSYGATAIGDYKTFDLNGNGTTSGEFVILNGIECLTFFMAGPGILQPEQSSTGFAASPSAPFTLTGTSRVGPFFELDPSRLLDIDGDGAPELADPLPNQTVPYQYLCSYGGQGYRPYGVSGDPAITVDNEVFGGFTYVYLKVDSNWPDEIGPVTTAPDQPPGIPGLSLSEAWNSKSFQIISPGSDGEFGIGGLYRTEEGAATWAGTTADSYRNNRDAEADNIANFSGGKMQSRPFVWNR